MLSDHGAIRCEVSAVPADLVFQQQKWLPFTDFEVLFLESADIIYFNIRSPLYKPTQLITVGNTQETGKQSEE